MAFHTFVYQNTAVGANAVNTALTAVSDGILYLQNSHIVPPKDLQLYDAAACGASITRARLISPSIRQIANSHIRPVNASAQFPDNPKVMQLWDNPLTLRGLEELTVDVSNNLGASTESEQVVLFAGDGIQPAPQGNIIRIRATGSTTVTANAWTQVPLTFDDTIPVGQYVCVGFTPQSSTCLASRLTFDGQFFRPGSLGLTSVTNTEHWMFQTRQLGVYGSFRSTSAPRVEYFCTAADTTQVVYLDIIRVSS